MSVQHDLSILEYARHHNLTRDYSTLLPKCEDSPSSFSSVSDELDESTNLPDLRIPDAGHLDEKWSLDGGGAAFLKDVLAIAQSDVSYEYPTRRYETRRLGFPSPLLGSDPALDMAVLFHRRKIEEQDTRGPSTDRWQLEESAESKLFWPTSESSLLERVNNQLRSEKLAISMSSISYLRDVTSGSWREDDEDILPRQPREPRVGRA